MKTISSIPFYMFVFLLSWTQILGQNDSSVQGSFGTVTIDGKLWNQVALRPVIPIGKFGVALDIVLYIDGEGNIHKDEWDFSNLNAIKNTLIDKIYYIRYGHPWDPLYFRVGALDYVSLGYGILVNGYSNSILYPQVRKVGLDFSMKRGKYSVQGFINDFKENLGVIGLRVSNSFLDKFQAGFTITIDRNQYLGLKDSDNDGKPDAVDDFPNNSSFFLDTDEDGTPDEIDLDIDGDGITDILDENIPGWNLDTTIILDTDIVRKSLPLDINENSNPVTGLALDFSYPIFSDENKSVALYAQIAKLFGKTIDPGNGNEVSLGLGLVPFGLATTFGPVHFNLEYRIIPNMGRFDFGYWDRSYDVERAVFKQNPDGEVDIVTKESTLGKFGRQKGYFSRMNIDVGSLFIFGTEYQNLVGNVWDIGIDKFEKAHNQSLKSTLSLQKSISKIKSASLYYQQRNAPNPFEFNYTESTVMGYRVGIEVATGLILNYVFQRSFRDLNGDGDVRDEDEVISITTIETSFSF